MKENDEAFAWVRVPIEHAKQFALEAGKVCTHFGDFCYSGSICICHPHFDEDASIVLKGKKDEDFGKLVDKIERAPGLNCFGGDSCIV